MCFRKPWLGVKSVNFDFCAKWSSANYNESYKPNLKFLTHIWSTKSLVTCSSKNWAFSLFSHFSLYFSPWTTISAKLSSTDYNESNKPNPKFLAFKGLEKTLVELKSSKKWGFSRFSLYWKVYFFTLRHGSLKHITYAFIKEAGPQVKHHQIKFLKAVEAAVYLNALNAPIGE